MVKKCCLLFAVLAFFVVAGARADIIKIQSTQSCNVIGLDSSPATAQGGVHCDTGNTAFSLTDILNGTIALYVGNSQTPSWNVVNDTGMAITSLTLFYSGALDSNADIDMQVSGTTIFTACVETTAASATFSDSHCGTGDIAPAPVDLPLEMTWSGTGVANEGTFNIGTASFAHGGADAGCISGTASCSPVTATPEPSSLALLGSGVLALAGVVRRRFKG